MVKLEWILNDLFLGDTMVLFGPDFVVECVQERKLKIIICRLDVKKLLMHFLVKNIEKFQ